jgi:hypothetical protein
VSDDRQAPAGDPPRNVAAELQERTHAFTRFYERHAYLVYNLTLRATCEEPRAKAATERAFLERAFADDSDDALVGAAVAAALGEAPRKPQPVGGGSAESEALLAATATLQPAERTALALSALWGADAEKVGAALGIGGQQATQLLDAAWTGLTARLHGGLDAVKASYADWLWANPPDDLWEGIFRGFAQALERSFKQEAAAASAPAAADGATPKPSKGRRSRKASRPKRRLRLPKRARIAIVVGAPLILAGAVLGVTQLSAEETPQDPTTVAPVSPSDPGYGEIMGEDDEAVTSSGEDGDKDEDGSDPRKRKPLTASELDKLRMKELKELQLYSKRETDRRLTQEQRDYARKRVGALRDLAQRRLAAERREKALARRERELARREARAGREPRREREPERREEARPPPTSRPERKDDDESRTQSEADKECLYDADAGTYICPK